MKKYIVGSLAALMIAGTSLQAKVYATVDGADITDQELKVILHSLPGANFSSMSKEQQSKIIDQAIERMLLSKKAFSEGVQDSPEYKSTLESIKKDLALEVWMKQQFGKVKISDKEMQDFYKENDQLFAQPATVKARHILLKTEKEAKDVIDELKKAKGSQEKFIALAKEKSTGPSGPNGGDLGWFDEKRMVKEFSDAAFALKKGDYTKAPVKTQFGYHVILVEDKKAAGKTSFEDAKPKIDQSLKMKKFQEHVSQIGKDLRAKAKVELKETK